MKFLSRMFCLFVALFISVNSYAGIQSSMSGSVGNIFESALKQDVGTAGTGKRYSTFKPSQAVSDQVKQEIINMLAEKTSANVSDLQVALKEVQLLSLLSPTIKQKKMETNDFITALTMFFTSCYGYLNELETSDEQDMAVWRQLEGAMQSMSSIQELTNEQKQQFSEYLNWMTLFYAEDYENAKKGKPGYDLNSIKQSVKETMGRFNIDLELIAITDKGMVAKESVGKQAAIHKNQPQNSATAPQTQSTNINAFQHVVGQYKQPSWVEGLYCGFESGIVGMNYKVTNYVYLLHEDGSAYRGLETPPEYFDVEKSRREEPKQWGKWKKTSEGYEVKIADEDWKEVRNATKMTPARPGERLNRSIHHASAYGMAGITSSSVFKNYWLFNFSGRFSKGDSALHSSASASMTPFGTTVTSSHASDDTGSSSTVLATGDSFVASSNRDTDDGSKNRGQYRLNGYTMQLQYDNGDEENVLIGFCYGDRSDLFLGNKVYWISKSSAEDELPVNWKEKINEKEQLYFVPDDLKKGETYELSISDFIPGPLKNSESWIRQVAKNDMAGLAAQVGEGNFKEGQMPIFSQPFKTKEGKNLVAVYFILNRKNDSVGYLKIVTSHADIMNRYQSSIMKAVKKIFS